MKPWVDDEIKFLQENYPQEGKMWCAEKLGRNRSSITQKAHSLGLRLDQSGKFWKDFQFRAGQSKIGKKRPAQAVVMKKLHEAGKLKQSKEQRKRQGKFLSAYFKKCGHPRGMLGKRHSAETRKRFSEVRLGKKHNLTTEQRKKISDRARAMILERLRNKGSVYSRGNSGWYTINNSLYYFRSSWETVYARYLEWLKGLGRIEKWTYEEDTFWFENIRRGVRSYMPDFKVWNTDGTIEYHEVKGYMDEKSKTKIKRLAKYYPDIILRVIDEGIYKDVKKYERMFPEAVVTKK